MPRQGEVICKFATAKAWAAWLEKNHRTHAGLWLELARKGSALNSVSFNEALEIALCYGWITGQARSGSKNTWLSRFVPRSESSIWSRINREKAEALIAAGRMRPAGMEAVEQAKKNGQWIASYDSPRRAKVPSDFEKALDASPRARAFFDKLDGRNRYAILFRLQTVKLAETRAKKIRQFVEMLGRGEKIHP